MKEQFKQYYARLAKESFFKALLSGSICGFLALFLSAAIIWFAGWEQIWVCAIVFAVVFAIATVIFYYKKFRPHTKAIAKRIDELGLEERILTMTELQDQDSYIARRQREDALKSLQTVNAKLLKFSFSKFLIASTCIACVISLGMTTISTLSALGAMPSGKDLLENANAGAVIKYDLEYDFEGDGEIIGSLMQQVAEGEDAEPVMAVAEEGWMFIEWSDGLKSPYRCDKNVTKDLSVTAIFMEAQDDVEDEDEGDFGDDQPGQPNDKGDGPPNNQQLPQDKEQSSESRLEETDQYKDGETWYPSDFDQSLEEALDGMNQDGNLGDGQKGTAGSYFENIAQSGKSEGDGGEGSN